eukprot:CAMPEP_0113716888 /NCGR_PEP_ID=MMETSP0038_2-20120614/34177_1 /TAXON_ID=2898 /ORGANISM="Cryptomonas paramecium" /LENGTH=140 /DNA_ID=CAMNT_0000644535 /DNA_START=127 /DNA_END=546 /DNA_ORIENTATION=- /assembly_acc=CAM_ASM_000170
MQPLKELRLGARGEGGVLDAERVVGLLKRSPILRIRGVKPSPVAEEPVARRQGQRLLARPRTHESTRRLQQFVELRARDFALESVPSIARLAHLRQDAAQSAEKALVAIARHPIASAAGFHSDGRREVDSQFLWILHTDS